MVNIWLVEINSLLNYILVKWKLFMAQPNIYIYIYIYIYTHTLSLSLTHTHLYVGTHKNLAFDGDLNIDWPLSRVCILNVMKTLMFCGANKVPFLIMLFDHYGD